MNIKEELTKLEKLINESLKEAFNVSCSYEKKIYESMEYSVFSGGKRLRPIMAIKSYEIFNKDYKNILPFAKAIEMIHTYSLIHDDLPDMDDDDFRRDKPTNHKVFGNAIAILAGDGLLNLAFETISKHINNNSFTIEDYKKNLRAMNEIAKYSGTQGMVGGQLVDLLASEKNMNEDKLIFMYKTKTAALFQASVVTGAILGGADHREIDILREFALYLGLAYQIRDDILDAHEDREINKITYLSYYNIEKAEEEIFRLSEKALNLLEELKGKDTEFLRELTDLLVQRKM